LAIYAKGGECMSPKQKDRTTTNLKFFGFAIGTNFKKKVFNWYDFQIGISLCSKRGESSIFKINILKPSWTLRGGIYQGGVLFSQRRSIWNRGRKCFAKSYSFTFDYLQKKLWKGFTKEFAKTKHVVQAWSKMLKMKKQSMRIL
jgi:hypothetical protein